jgi:hypothetical protein
MIVTSEPQRLEFGETWVCRFPFTSGRGAKARLVLVIRDLEADYLCLPHHVDAALRLSRLRRERFEIGRIGQALDDSPVSARDD